MCCICDVNILAIIVSIAVYMALSMVWYGPLFGKQWIKLVGMTEKDAEKARKEGGTKTMVMGLVGGLVIVFVLGMVLKLAMVRSAFDGMMVGALVAVGFVLTNNLNRVLWEKRPIKLFWLNTLHALVTLMVIGAILGAWV
jgi:hypothetical protein